MGELDYQLALVLQHRFEQEHKARIETQKKDQAMARELQVLFEQEAAIDNPSSGLVYSRPKTELNSSKCLIDPSWELVDPTPDVHILFMAFNDRFFWSKLVTVCVSWSKRMTTCAGVCSYNDAGGMCRITLSEPLLKLRPRKDLVETLLHEMIHAYLFVTHNDRDRDGHGLEFHKHMFRINNEAGTNITVYHDFHDEVRLYKQHWWRCNGPCQHRKPYFGMVKRAHNRSPSHNDRWWDEHVRTCGGQFIKVKEPEKKKKEEKKTETQIISDVKSKDIRNYFPTTKEIGSSNIIGFKDLNNPVGGKYNSSSTIVVTKNSSTSTNGGSSFKPTVFNTSPTTVKTETDSNTCTEDFKAVRNHWANKFTNTNKRPAEQQVAVSKIPKKWDSPLLENYCECPVCNKPILKNELNDHLDLCLDSTAEPTQQNIADLTPRKEQYKECALCNATVNASVFEAHLEKCIFKIYDKIEEQLSEPIDDKVSCLACDEQILRSQLNSHLEVCMNDFFQANMEENGANDASDNAENSEDDREEKNQSENKCPFCMQQANESAPIGHFDDCPSIDTDTESLTDDL